MIYSLRDYQDDAYRKRHNCAMSTTQPDQREAALPSQAIGSSETSLEASPPPPPGQRTSGSLVTILWGVLLLFGVLILLTRGPLNAPAAMQAVAGGGTRSIYLDL